MRAAITWQVANDSDCTGLNAATGLAATARVPCCRGSAASGANNCSTRINVGANWMRSVAFVVGPNPPNVYTVGGDPLPAAALTKIGFTNVFSAICTVTQGNPTWAGTDVVWVPTAPTTGFTYGAKLQLWVAGTELTAQPVNNVATVCLLIGY